MGNGERMESGNDKNTQKSTSKLPATLLVTGALLTRASGVHAEVEFVCGYTKEAILRMTQLEKIRIINNIRNTVSKEEGTACNTAFNAIRNPQIKANYDAHNASVDADRAQRNQASVQLYVNDPNFCEMVQAGARADQKVVYIDQATGQRIDPKTGKPIE